MKPQKPFHRFLLGLGILLIVTVLGFAWVAALIPTWGATLQEVQQTLPGDELIPQPQMTWDHAITIQAAPEQIYPWLVQIGDSRAAFYSITFIENLFMLAGKTEGRYVNAGRIHPEWQTPPTGQGIIVDYMAIHSYQPDEYVLASATPKLEGMHWTWLWAVQPLTENSSRLIVRHRFAFPEGAPKSLLTAVLDAGYVMERGMLLGIQDRAEGRIPPAFAEPLGILLWLIALACGILAAVRFIRRPGAYHPLGISLEAVVVLFILTFIQPDMWLRILLDLLLIGSVVIAYLPGRVSALLRVRAAA